MKLIRYFRHYRSDEANKVPNQFPDDKLIDYLLGGLRRKEEASLEQQYFQDDDQFEYLRAMEDDLIDRYLLGELTARQRHRFETHFLATPLRRDRVQSARALIEAVAPAIANKSIRRNSWQIPWKALTWSFACSVLVLAASLSWLIWKNIRLQNQLTLANLALEHRERGAQSRAVAPSAPLAVSFVLAPVQRDLGMKIAWLFRSKLRSSTSRLTCRRPVNLDTERFLEPRTAIKWERLRTLSCVHRNPGSPL